MGSCTHEMCSVFTKRTYFSKKDGRHLVHLVRALSEEAGELGQIPDGAAHQRDLEP